MAETERLIHWNRKSIIEKDKWFRKIGYEPHDGQWQFHRSRARFRLMSCGWGWGKSRGAAADYEPLLLAPRTVTWIVAPSYELGEKPFRVFWYDLLAAMGRDWVGEGTRSRYSVEGGRMRIETPDQCGSSILAVKTERHPESLEGEDVDAAIFEELGEMKRSTFERVYGRLRMGGEACGLYTPDGFGFPHDLLLRSGKEEFPDWWSRTGPSWENPHLDPAFVESARRDLTREAFEAKIEGKARTGVGFVLSDFDPAIHVASVPYDPALPTWGCIDYGYTNPFVFLLCQVAASDQLRVVREYYQSHLTTAEHGEYLKVLLKDMGITNLTIYDDPSGADERATLRKMGLSCVGVTREVNVGVELLRRQLKPRPGTPGLTVDRGCTNTIREFLMWRYPERREEREANELPLKANDHAPEALTRGVCAWKRATTSAGLKFAAAGKLDAPRTDQAWREQQVW
jgi:hypothetical protein